MNGTYVTIARDREGGRVDRESSLVDLTTLRARVHTVTHRYTPSNDSRTRLHVDTWWVLVVVAAEVRDTLITHLFGNLHALRRRVAKSLRALVRDSSS